MFIVALGADLFRSLKPRLLDMPALAFKRGSCARIATEERLTWCGAACAARTEIRHRGLKVLIHCYR